MSEICPKCGLVEELCVCETIAKESQLIKVFLERKKFRKFCTIIEGIDQKEIDTRRSELLASLRRLRDKNLLPEHGINLMSKLESTINASSK